MSEGQLLLCIRASGTLKPLHTSRPPRPQCRLIAHQPSLPCHWWREISMSDSGSCAPAAALRVQMKGARQPVSAAGGLWHGRCHWRRHGCVCRQALVVPGAAWNGREHYAAVCCAMLSIGCLPAGCRQGCCWHLGRKAASPLVLTDAGVARGALHIRPHAIAAVALQVHALGVRCGDSDCSNCAAPTIWV
jgi:hypothetical protein